MKDTQDKVKQLLQRADNYAQFVAGELELPLPEEETDECAFEEELEHRRLHFLFPNLTESERDTIETLAGFQASLSVGINTPSQGLSEAEKQTLEQTIREGGRARIRRGQGQNPGMFSQAQPDATRHPQHGIPKGPLPRVNTPPNETIQRKSSRTRHHQRRSERNPRFDTATPRGACGQSP
jgi:hypothetical protein